MYQRLRLSWRIGRARRRMASKSFFEKELFLIDNLVDGGTALDIGANKGIYSYMLAKVCDRVIAFEANQSLADKLRRALPRHCEVFAKAASDENGTATFYIPVEQDSGTADRPNVGSMERPEGPMREVTVETQCLDDLPVDDVRFVKIDVEGHEAAVLAGAWGLMEAHRPTVLLEILNPNGSEARDIFKRFRSMGYQCMQLQNRELRAIPQLPESNVYRNYIFLPLAA